MFFIIVSAILLVLLYNNFLVMEDCLDVHVFDEDVLLDTSTQQCETDLSSSMEACLISDSNEFKNEKKDEEEEEEEEEENTCVDDNIENVQLLSEIQNLKYELEACKKLITSMERNMTAIDSSNSNCNSRHQRITYDYNESLEPRVVYPDFLYNMLRIFINFDVKNYGKVVGKNGNNRRYIEDLCKVTIYVPPKCDIRTNNKNIMLLNHSNHYAYNRMNRAENLIIQHLTS